MATKKQYAIVLAEKYNNSTNVLFMMEVNDFESRNRSLGYENYKPLELVESHSKKAQLATTVSGKQYKLFSDHSLLEVK